MPIKGSFSSDRFEILDNVSESCIDMVAENPKVKVLQTSSPITIDSWKLINDRLIGSRPDIQIRIYGHYSAPCDLNILQYIPSVENLAIDCLRDASNFDHIKELKRLKSLSVGIYHLDSFDFLKSLPKSIEKIFLGGTKSNKPSLDGLENLTNLKELYIDGQNKNLDAIGNLNQLERLTLRSVSPNDIKFVRNLPKLWSLDIKLGGIRDLNPIEGLHNLKYLELWQVKGLSDISVVSTLIGLQYLFLQSLINVKAFPDMCNLVNIRRIYLEAMKGLEDLEGLFNAPNLEEFIHVRAQNMTPNKYEPLLKLASLKKALFGFGSDKKNQQMDKMMQDHNIKKYTHEQFAFK